MLSVFVFSLLVCSFALEGWTDELNTPASVLVVDTLAVCNRTISVEKGFAYYPKLENLTFDQFRLEEVLFELWRAYRGMLFGKAVVVPSPVEWCIFNGQKTWDWKLLNNKASIEINRDKLSQYWEYLLRDFDSHLIFIIHVSFAWDNIIARDTLLTLSWLRQKRPSDLKRFVFVSLDGPNLFKEDRQKIMIDENQPLMISAPYPTRGHPPLSATDERPREFLVILEGKFRNNKGWRPTRKKLHEVMGQRLSICKQKSPNCKHRDGADVWQKAMNSQYCMEPPGDTVTRSHLAVAILAGCIPILFDGEVHSENLQDVPPPSRDSKHNWPWRDTIGFSLNYTDFAVIVNSVDFIEGRYDLLHEIRSIPWSQYIEMRKKLLAVAPYFVWNKTLPVNAFTSLTKVIEAYADTMSSPG